MAPEVDYRRSQRCQIHGKRQRTNLSPAAFGRSGAHTPGNPLAALTLEVTFFFVFAIPLAYAVSRYRAEWFFPAMLLLIGGRYLTFATLYGMRVYWACGATLALVRFLLVVVKAPAWLVLSPEPWSSSCLRQSFWSQCGVVGSRRCGMRPKVALPLAKRTGHLPWGGLRVAALQLNVDFRRVHGL
jgi:hypothetical protein